MPRPFLTARWSNLCIFSYHVPRALLTPRLPRGLELDVPPNTADDLGVVSLVAFDFLDTRVRGVKWPRHVNFPEVNLRFYVQLPGTAPEPARRGVMFIREFVPRPLISFVAQTFYNEPYAALRMTSSVIESAQGMEVEHRISPKDGTPGVISITASPGTETPPDTSLEHWLKEHQWGFGISRSGEMLVYRVIHPVWATRPVREWKVNIDWTALYGHDWGFLARIEPFSVLLAQGSPVEVHPKRVMSPLSSAPIINTSPGDA